MARVVVIGAGVGGLAAAARLAAGGHTVTVCEQADRAGGKLGRYVHGDFRFDTGPSLLTLPQVFEDLFAATGAPIERVLRLVPVTPVARYRFADGTVFDVDGDLQAVRRTFGEGEALAWRQLHATAGAAWPAVFTGVLSAPRAAVPRVRPDMIVPVLRMAPWRSLSTVARRWFNDPRLRAYLERYATYAGSDPRRTSGMLAVISYLEQAYGAWHVSGGLYRIAEALVDRCTELGVTLRLRAPVGGIDTAGGRASGVILASGERLPADVVVANVDATGAYAGLLPPARRTPAALRQARPSVSGFVLLLGVRGRTPGLAHHTVLFPADYHAEFDAIFARSPVPVPDPTVYVCAPDDPVMRPDRYESWFVLVNAPAHGTGPNRLDWDTPGLAGRYRDQILAVLARRGFPLADRIEFGAVRTPADLARDTAAPGGTIYGTAARGPWRDLRRPSNGTHLPNVFLVGGSVHPGGGLPLVALSAAIVANQIGPA